MIVVVKVSFVLWAGVESISGNVVLFDVSLSMS